MGVNTLIENPPSQSKPWCNIYVDTLTSYRNSNVRGNLNISKEIVSPMAKINTLNVSKEVVSSVAKFNTLIVNDGQPIDISYYKDIQNKVRYCGEIVAENSCSYSRLGRQVTLKIGKFIHTNSRFSYGWWLMRTIILN